MSKRAKKKPVRGSGVSITLPTEPTAGDAKAAAVMAVMVSDDGVPILEYELKLGNAIEFRVGGATKAFMERVGPAPDSEIYIDTLGRERRARDSRIRARARGGADEGLAARPAAYHQPRHGPALGHERTNLGVRRHPYQTGNVSEYAHLPKVISSGVGTIEYEASPLSWPTKEVIAGIRREVSRLTVNPVVSSLED